MLNVLKATIKMRFAKVCSVTRALPSLITVHLKRETRECSKPFVRRPCAKLLGAQVPHLDLDQKGEPS